MDDIEIIVTENDVNLQTTVVAQIKFFEQVRTDMRAEEAKDYFKDKLTDLLKIRIANWVKSQ